MAKKDHVEVQKGPLKDHEDTYRTMPFSKKVREAEEHYKMRKDYQSLHLHEPKK